MNPMDEEKETLEAGQQKRRRIPAEERRNTVLEAALAEFARKGYYGASTEAIARRAEISHPYLFKLFSTKRDLFLETMEFAGSRIGMAFHEAIAETPDDPIGACHRVYARVAERYRNEFMMTLHGFAASDDPEIRRNMRETNAAIHAFMTQGAGIPPVAARAILAEGMSLVLDMLIEEPPLAEDYPTLPPRHH